MRRAIATSIIALAFVGCASSPYKEFYKQYADPKTLENVEPLGEDQEPRVIHVADLSRERDIALARGYRIVGESVFNGPGQKDSAAAKQAKSVGATLVLISTKYAGTQSVTTPLVIPNNQTTYNNGSVYGSGGYASYSGTSTTYGSTVIPVTSQAQRFDQSALFLIKSTVKPRFGALYANLSPELRTKYERNTGVWVRVVVEGSAAFLANILPGDVIVELNETPVVDAPQFNSLLRSQSADAGVWRVKLLRNGVEKVIEFKIPAI